MGFRALNAELRVLVSKLQRLGHKSLEPPLGLVLAPNPFRSRKKRRDFQLRKTLTLKNFEWFCESGKKSYMDGIHVSLSDAAGSKVGGIENPPKPRYNDEDACFSVYSSFFFPEDVEVPGGFSSKNGFSSFVKSNPVPHKRGQCSVNTKSTPASWEDDFEEDGKTDSPQQDTRLQCSIERLEAYMATLDDKRTLDQRYTCVIKKKLPDKALNSRRWTEAVNVMAECRSLKELLINVTPRPVGQLNRLDRKEKRALSVLYGNFKYLSGFSDVVLPELFDKNKLDDIIEKRFGSIDNRDTEPITSKDAQTLFSQYLARKVWVHHPWTKIQAATEEFYKRTVFSPIKEEVDQKAQNIALQILNILMDMGGDEIEQYRDVEPAPEASCTERSKAEGGKRFAMLFGGKRQTSYVKPVSIFTGGKIRTITKDSVEYVKYHWINKWLGAQFRKLPCSIFGGDVEEWYRKVGSAFLEGKGKFVSGDLESATDLFDGRISSSLIELLAERLGLDAKEMKSFTTEALFKVSKSKFLRQTRGQLMGSVLSFPLLCILSLTAYLHGRKDVGKLFDPKKGRAYLMALKSVGINGDDIVFKATNTGIESWVAGVKAVGGRVSRGKTLVNDTYFTVNSELWSSTGKINCARPSLLTALTGDNRYFISPQYEWKEYLRSDIISQLAKRVYDLTRKLKVNVPRSMGGLGLTKEFDPEQMFDAYKRCDAEKEFSHVVLFSEKYEKEQNAIKEGLSWHGPRYETWVSREGAKAFSKIYTSKAFNFRLKPHEIRFCLTILQRSDVFNSAPIEKFRTQFERIEFPEMERLEKRWAFFKSQIISRLETDYDLLMDPNLKRVKIPVNLIQQYNGLVTDDVNDMIVADDNFRLDHGSRCCTDFGPNS